MGTRQFHKMHGLGNDFVVIDARQRPFAADAARIRAIADRRTGVGCDQFITLEPPRHPSATVFMRIHNADGGEVEACGNAARCVAHLMLQESNAGDTTIETVAGLSPAHAADGGIAIDMGPANLDWQQIPLASAANTLHVPVTCSPLSDAVAVNVGNPHAVFFVPDAAAIDLAAVGPVLEHDPMFPQRANISVCHVAGTDHLRLRVWERGVGITRACGTAACATMVAAHRRGLSGRSGIVELDGGKLRIEWRADNHIIMTGPAAYSFAGELPDA